MLRLLSFFLLLPFLAQSQASFVPDERAYYGLINRGSGRSLDVASASTASGAVAVQWEFTHSPSQQWRFVPLRAGSEYYRIEARHCCSALPWKGRCTRAMFSPALLTVRHWVLWRASMR